MNEEEGHVHGPDCGCETEMRMLIGARTFWGRFKLAYELLTMAINVLIVGYGELHMPGAQQVNTDDLE